MKKISDITGIQSRDTNREVGCRISPCCPLLCIGHVLDFEKPVEQETCEQLMTNSFGLIEKENAPHRSAIQNKTPMTKRRPFFSTLFVTRPMSHV